MREYLHVAFVCTFSIPCARLPLRSYVKGTFLTSPFTSLLCVEDQSQMVLFNIIAQAIEQTGGTGALASALSSEMTTAASVTADRFPMSGMQVQTDSLGNAQVMIEILPAMNPETEPTAEEIVGIFERVNRQSLLGENSLMSANNMDITCMDCAPRTFARRFGVYKLPL